MKIAFVAALVLITLGGCAISPKQIEKSSDLDVCASYGVYRTGILAASAPNYMDEIKKRNLLSPDELELVRNKRIKTGMSLCALYASWGRPDRENRTVMRSGTRIQHVFNAGYRYIQKTYVYTENGIVAAWQD